MRLHVLTAVSRPENLGRVAESLAAAAAYAPAVDVTWHWRMDTLRRHVGGQHLKNMMLDEIDDGFVWILDDDTVAHEEVIWQFTHLRNRDGIVFSQQRTDGRILWAAPENVRLGYIDVGQAFLSRECIGDRRIPLQYDGDFWWLQECLTGADVCYAKIDVLSLHNAISGVDVSV